MFEREDSYNIVMKIFRVNHKHKTATIFRFVSYFWLLALLIMSLY